VPRELHFAATDPSAVVERMSELAGGSGWLVLDAAVMSDDVPPAPPFGGIFSGRGPVVPEVSWVPGEAGRRRPEPLSVGIRHAAGPKAVRRLAEAGHPVPEGWRVVQDNPRRGLVIQLPPGADHAEVLRWLLDAAGVLTTVPLTGNWRARIHLRG
jgi:hypothetical protein